MWKYLLLLGSGAGINWAVSVNSGRRGHGRLRVSGGVGRGVRIPNVTARGDVDLNKRWLRAAGVWQATKRAAARCLANGRLSPARSWEWESGMSKVLLKLVVVGAIMNAGSHMAHATMTPSLRGILVLGGAELASSLGLLLERLLLLRVGISDLYLEIFSIGCDGVIVVRLDDVFARVARFEAGCRRQRCR